MSDANKTLRSPSGPDEREEAREAKAAEPREATAARGGGAAQKTVFAVRLADPRERSAQPKERARGRGAQKAEATSDRTRFRGVLAAAITGGVAAIAAALLAPPPGGHTSPGPLSRPHARAGLGCAACHGEGGARDRASYAATGEGDPSRACGSCHGAHGSERAGHAKMIAAGAMRCATCHAIHRGDQGVTFSPSEAPIRFAPGVEARVAEGAIDEGAAFRPARAATVAIPTAGSCAGCHDLAAPRDPIARCLIQGQESLGAERPIVCFDEHQPAHPDDTRAAIGGRGGRGGDRAASAPEARGVCAAQHTSDRAAVWEAARAVVAAVPALSRPASSSGPLLWTGAGLAAAALAFGYVRGTSAIRDRRKRKLKEAVPEALVKPAARVRLPQIDTTTCLGCYACVDACPYDVLEIERYVAVVARPDACCGLTLCEQRCPNGSLQIAGGEAIGDRPRLDDDLQSLDVPGLYLAGDVTGLPLIKNAIHQGARAAERAAQGLVAKGRDGALDLLVVGAGPAGISAALRAKELGLAFEVIEQGSVAQSIRSFPRGKLVFDQPLELPMTGKLWLEESTKEELLSHWLRVVRKERLPIHEGTRMTAISRSGDGSFVVTTEPREGGPPRDRRARRVILAVGQRGTPRRLSFELAPEIEARVHYHLADARSFEGHRVLVVGLGDVAMEAAIALSRQPGTTVTVSYRGEGFSRGKARNIAELRRLVDAGRVALRFATEVTAIDASGATLRGPRGEVRVGCDAVFVMIGSIPPHRVLRACGVRTVADEARHDAPSDEAAPALG